jgi:hypothetical protein
MSGNLAAPHRAVEAADDREKFLVDLFDALWVEYRGRVKYVQMYEDVVAKLGGTFFNDHIAFRTFARQRPQVGVVTLSRLFQALGYIAAGCYQFPDKHLTSVHFQHANPRLPKLFISELETWKLSENAGRIIDAALAQHPPAISDGALHDLAHDEKASAERRQELLEETKRWFSNPLWGPPAIEDVRELNKESQFAAWVLVHGYRVNHFTALVNSHGTPALDDIEKTITAMKGGGIPMKAEIEGARGSKLRQTATEAVMVESPMLEAGEPRPTLWTYAYFEIAERGVVADPETGRTGRFEGFLGPQATNLFEMTKVK